MVQLNVSVRTQEHTFRPGLNPSEQTARWLSSQDSSTFSSGHVMRDTERKRLLHGGLCQALYLYIICGTPIHHCVPEGSHEGGLSKLALGVGSKQQHLSGLQLSFAGLNTLLPCTAPVQVSPHFLAILAFHFVIGKQGKAPSESHVFISLVGATIRLNYRCHKGHPGAVCKYDN